jgi:flavin reductase (DIM6/NTAB) family NADH-FMN oxidoreductase RutF
MSDAFETIVASLDYAMSVVTATAGGERSGCLVGFHMQCSIDPCRWLVCVSKMNHTVRVALAAQALAVHVLRDDQRALAELFGGETDDTVDKFARCAHRAGPLGTVVLEGCDYFAGRVVARHDLGDHIGHVIEVAQAQVVHPGRPLRFTDVRGMKPGHPP